MKSVQFSCSFERDAKERELERERKKKARDTEGEE